MRAHLVVLVAVLGSTVALSGCFSGAFFPSAITGTLPSGWSYDTTNSQHGESGNQLAKVQYQVNDYQNPGNQNGGPPPPGGIAVISVSNVPIVDLQAEIKKKLDDYVQQQGISLTQTGTGTTAVRGDGVQFTLYDAQKNVNGTTLHGRAIDAQWTCGANKEAVRFFGFASTEVFVTSNGGLLGGGSVTSQKNTDTWLSIVGTDPPGNPAGGMLGAVACS